MRDETICQTLFRKSVNFLLAIYFNAKPSVYSSVPSFDLTLAHWLVDIPFSPINEVSLFLSN